MRKVDWDGLRLIVSSSLGVLVSVPTVQKSAGHLKMSYNNKHKTQSLSQHLWLMGKACSGDKRGSLPFPHLSINISSSAC